MKTVLLTLFISLSILLNSFAQPTISSSVGSNSLVCPGELVDYSLTIPDGYSFCSATWSRQSGAGTFFNNITTGTNVKVTWNEQSPNQVTLQAVVRFRKNTVTSCSAQGVEEVTLTISPVLRSVFQESFNSVSPITVPYCPSGQPIATISVNNMYIKNTGSFGEPPLAEVERYEWIIPAGWKQYDTGLSGTVYSTIPIIQIQPTNPSGICSSGGSLKVRGIASGATKCVGQIPSISNQLTILLNRTPEFTLSPQSGYSGQTCNQTTPVTFTATPMTCASDYSWSFPNQGTAWTGSSDTNVITLTPDGSSNTQGPITITANLNGCTLSKTYNITFTKPTYSITGTGPVCTSGQSFQINNVPANSTTTWTATPTELFSANTGTGIIATVAAASQAVSGWGTVDFTVVNTFCSINDKKSIGFQVGKPSADNSTLIYPSGKRGIDPVPLCAGCSYNFMVDFVPGATSYTWVIPSGFSFVSGRFSSIPGIKVSSTNGTYVMYCSPQNACGSVWTHNLTINIGGGGGHQQQIAAYPNPATSSLTVESTESNLTILDSEITESEYTPTSNQFTAKLFDKNNSELRNGESKNGKITFDVNDLQNGFYILHIIKGQELITRQILINK
jgi:hypothetical protein